MKKTIAKGTAGQAIAMANEKIAVTSRRKSAVNRTNSLTKNPTALETKLSTKARNFSSIERPPELIIRFQGEKSVDKSIGKVKASWTLFSKIGISRHALAHPFKYHHDKRSKSMSLLYPNLIIYFPPLLKGADDNCYNLMEWFWENICFWVGYFYDWSICRIYRRAFSS